jgi:capsular exopolysaccharide synthesis family protein
MADNNSIQADTLQNFNNANGNGLGLLSIKEIIYKYLSYLPLILLIFFISFACGIAYNRYATPVYKASAKVFVKNGEENSAYPAGQDSKDVLQMALVGNGKVINLDNEIIRLKSLALLSQVVEKNNFNINIINVGRNNNIYKSAPFKFSVFQVKDSSIGYQIKAIEVNNQGVTIELNGKASFMQYGTIGGDSTWQYSFNKSGFIQKDIKEPFFCSWQPIAIEAGKISKNLTVAPFSKTTSLLQLDLRTDSPERGIDILNAIINQNSSINLVNKSLSAKNTINFINDRLLLLAKELTDVEDDLSSLRKNNQLFDLGNYTGIMMGKTEQVDLKLQEIEFKNLLITDLLSYVQQPNNIDSLVPINFGIDNGSLNQTIGKYNETLLKKKREKPFNAFKNSIIQDYDNQLKNTRVSIIEMLKNLKNTNLQILAIEKQKKAELNNEIGKIPEKERALQEILSKVAIKKELYLYLLKKREETAIASSTTLSNYEQLDTAVASFEPIEPNKTNIRNFSMLIGIILPIFIIYVIGLFNDKVTTREEVQKKLGIAVAGEVSHVSNDRDFVFVNSRHVVAEQFRLLRANLQYLLHDINNCKVIMITSTMSGEGKSFISANLAASLALLDKKVAFLQLDLRKGKNSPALEKIWQTALYKKGISNYLIGQIQNPEELYLETKEYPGLHLYFSGPVPPNPAELIMSEKNKNFILNLKNKYDFIVIDSAPVGLVSDAFLLSDTVDLTLYILRQRYTLKKQMDYINEINSNHKFKRMAVIVNDVVVGGRYGYYGYNYTYGYSYTSIYGYGYKYANTYTRNSYFNMDSELKLPWWVKLTQWFGKFKK